MALVATKMIEGASPCPVFVDTLRLADFRNYADLEVRTDPGVVVLTGANGAGKTNLLEALSLLAPGRGLRRATLSQLPRLKGSGAWAIFASFNANSDKITLGTGQTLSSDPTANTARKVRINGSRSTVTDLDTYLTILWLTPSMDGLFTGPASDRRRFLDRLTAAFEHGHNRRVMDFETLLRTRNRLLAEPPFDPALLGIVETQMAELAVAIAYSRLALVEALNKEIIAAELSESLFPSAHLGLKGSLEESLLNGQPLPSLEDRYRETLLAERKRDQAAGRTLSGPHTSDLTVAMTSSGMPASLSSTGQQKALLISLLMAEASLSERARKLPPVLLLDEVTAHLDALRRAALFDYLTSLRGQTWLTGTDSASFEALEKQATYLVVADALVKQG